MSSGSRIALAALLTLAALGAIGTAGPVAAAAAGVQATAADAPVSPAQSGQGQVDSGETPFRSNTSIEIQLEPDGDARFTLTVQRFNLTNERERNAFQQIARDHENGNIHSQSLESFRQAISDVDPADERQMQIDSVEYGSFTREHGDGNATGVLQVGFTWRQFAEVGDNSLKIGDVFEMETGPWLQLEPGQQLVFKGPDGYTPVDCEGHLRNQNCHWEGPVMFTEDVHSVEFSGSPIPMVYAGLLAGGVVIVLVLVLLARYRGVFTHSGDEGRTPAPAAEGAAANGDEPATDSGSAAAPADGADDEVDLELLSDEERVERLLEQNGGRMKQASIVQETGWSNAKVSQLLSAMEEEDRIDKLRIGRENLISFPDEDVADIEE